MCFRDVQAYTDSTCIRAVPRRVGSKKAFFWRVYRFLVSKDFLGKKVGSDQVPRYLDGYSVHRFDLNTRQEVENENGPRENGPI